MAIKKEYHKNVTEALKKLGSVKTKGSTLKDGSIEEFTVNTKKPLQGYDIRVLAELTAQVPVEVNVKRSGAGLVISAT